VARFLDAHRLPKSGCVWPRLTHVDWKSAGLALEARAARGEDALGVTGVFCALAETGTLMMVSGADTPAATSLLPETHVAIVPVERVVPCMEDGWDLLRAEHGQLPRAVNFISGPSRTADIEQTLVLGAHGPYRVHLVLVG
jgi:L-lactate dehydrogenase complex protein LldG